MNKLFTSFFLLITLISQAQTVLDMDGNIYHTVTIGTQTWTKENLRTTKYSNGLPIRYEAADSLWGGLTAPAFCTYNNDTAKRLEYGNLYNFYTVMQSDNVCPAGWHVPSYPEWDILIDFLGGDSIAGGKMKETGFTHWYMPNTGADNSSGLTVIPAGIRFSNKGFGKGEFHGLNGNGAIWTSTGSSDSTATAKYFYPGTAEVGELVDYKKSYGFSIRCVADMQTAIREMQQSNSDINIYPNPTGDLLTISIEGPKIIMITNLQGQVVRTIKTRTNTISLADLATGTYVISVFNPDNKFLGRKLIVFEK